ncbi:TetR family transcriptional regulator [Mycobacterium sp. IS-2888]|uniref:TetR/AcrR family transcriptional regulator n=1 Tax=unclassified Mycobacterium TaxID=2642494 RepID=UPI00096DFDA4|nr:MULTISPECIES: TetR/AcrR family transcriptional regulator [unclassified Mycobacterium]OMC46391.1 TetR family transcriptional regulator [Mycobacterium sp. IS-2888]OMC46542.1 TetR family transcriptional regulator [Mycobacterium sp. IS-1264]
MADSTDSDDAAPPTPPGKRERLIAAACDLFHRQGIAGTTLAHIAEAADVPLGNVYYYFKTKDDIVAAVVEARTDEIRSATAAVQRRHGSPKARLKALVGMLADSRDTIADHGCPLGTLCTELANQPGQSPALTAPLMQTLLDWAEQQFRAMGRRDARDLAHQLVIAYEGSAVLTNALAQPEIMTREARRLEKWINALEV